MNLVTTVIDNQHILYDSTVLAQPNLGIFSPETYDEYHTMQGGRNAVHFVSSALGRWVIRHYCRGGLMGKFNHDRYRWSSLEDTRAWRELHLLAELHQQGLPVPQPVAARVQRHRWFYRADIITAELPNAEPLSAALSRGALSLDLWFEIGQTIRCFHDANVDHADLNAHNILIRGEAAIYVLDFDRGAIRGCVDGNEDNSGAWREANIKRLRRSLDKLAGLAVEDKATFHFNEQVWGAFERGYQESATLTKLAAHGDVLGDASQSASNAACDSSSA